VGLLDFLSLGVELFGVTFAFLLSAKLGAASRPRFFDGFVLEVAAVGLKNESMVRGAIVTRSFECFDER